MSDDLAVGGPGTTTVLTTELEQESTRIARLGWEVDACRQQLVGLDRVVGTGILNAADAPLSALRAEQSIEEATAAMVKAREQCEILGIGLACAADRYSRAEQGISRMSEAVAARFGYLLGTIAPVLVAVLLPGIMAMGLGVAGFLAGLPEKTRAALLGSVGAWLSSNSSVLTDPRVVTAVRLTVMSADDFGAGLVRVPAHIADALGDEGLGIFGVDTSAAVIAGGAAAFGLLRESPVRVRAQSTISDVSPAHDVRDRLERIPENPDQVRVDRYSSPGELDRFEVYIAGTDDFSPVSGGEPFDLTSNVSAMAGGSHGHAAASYRATVEAMRQAGVGSDSPVTFTGYSQGGLVAAQLAASGDYAVEGLLTVGAPAGQVSVPHDIPYLAVEHSDDLVPALGGTFSSSDPVIVRRQVFDGAPPSSEPAMPAHRLPRYIDTAELIDGSENLKLREALHRLNPPHAQSVTSTTYHAERVEG